MYWKGLWATFGHHGDVVDAFIPRKRSRSGRRFGFFRYLSNTDAERAILRLNGFILFSYRIEVSRAKFGNRTSYRRNINRDQWGKTKLKTPNQNSQTIIQRPPVKRQVEHKVPEEVQSETDNLNRPSPSIQEEESRRKVTGYVEDETLWKLQRSLVGFTASDNDSRRISDRLCNWGLGEIKVKKMGGTGRVFLLEIEDKLMYNSLKETGWSILLETFTEIHPWSESFRTPERIVWIELSGVPPHSSDNNIGTRDGINSSDLGNTNLSTHNREGCFWIKICRIDGYILE
ncbi:hypothetical protein V6N13_061819 [Hibiscus sabdariffa]